MEKKFIITEKNASIYCKKIEEWINKYVKKASTDGVVLGMSGGIDCSTVAVLCKNAGVSVHLIMMPYGENMKKTKDYSDAMEIINKFKFDYHIFDIKDTIDSINIKKDSKILNEKNIIRYDIARANIMPRVRMIYLYQYAQINNLLVVGTGNLS